MPATEGQSVPEGMERIRIPANLYAVFIHRGSMATFQETVRYIWGTWVPSSGVTLAEAPDFERYDDRFDPRQMAGEVDIYVPIRTRPAGQG